MAEDPARPGSTKDRAPWSRVGDKVSAIRFNSTSQEWSRELSAPFTWSEGQ
jgi:hypothetical protein